MRRPVHDGQNPRFLHEYATTNDSPHWRHAKWGVCASPPSMPTSSGTTTPSNADPLCPGSVEWQSYVRAKPARTRCTGRTHGVDRAPKRRQFF
jgi:hypothetical protein